MPRTFLLGSKLFKFRNGFTLVELMVVISIISVLAVVGVTFYGSSQQKARNAKRISDIQEIAKTIDAHKNPSWAPINCQGFINSYCPIQGSWFSSGQLPTDPLGGSYCINSLSTTPMTPQPLGGCNTVNNWTVITAGVNPSTSTVVWSVCTNLEPWGSAVYCQPNLR